MNDVAREIRDFQFNHYKNASFEIKIKSLYKAYENNANIIFPTLYYDF